MRFISSGQLVQGIAHTDDLVDVKLIDTGALNGITLRVEVNGQAVLIITDIMQEVEVKEHPR